MRTYVQVKPCMPDNPGHGNVAGFRTAACTPAKAGVVTTIKYSVSICCLCSNQTLSRTMLWHKRQVCRASVRETRWKYGGNLLPGENKSRFKPSENPIEGERGRSTQIVVIYIP